MMNENFDINIQPLSSTSSSYSSSSSSSCSSTTSSSKFIMDATIPKKTNHHTYKPFCKCSYNENNIQENLNLVMGDLKQLCCTFTLLARQIDQVVNKIETKFGNLILDNYSDYATQNSLKTIKNFTKIINSANMPSVETSQKPKSINKINSSNRNENIINEFLSNSNHSNQKALSERKTDSNDYHDQSNVWSVKSDTLQRSKYPRSKSQPAFKDNNCIAPSSTNTNLNKFTMFDTNRMTSSPICTNDKLSNGENSSFYEDQLDNELESIRDNSSNEPVKTNEVSSSIIKKESSPPNSIQKIKPKSTSSNYHVSFNINNAIYTSKQETPIPIPISILKQANQQCKINQNDQQNSSLNTSPLQSSLKKSPGVNFGTGVENEGKNAKSSNSKSVRIDTKTTIL
ncbi:unnamed protein product [Brachionus calyciflorus]|uniref:Uncharacterized protein n=1 Tax=Brachionus calyciflorus TaxID=104777 RepID=A0A813QY36_9BILA|nr:unnamed protein product [Brachionus calyciflorus]